MLDIERGSLKGKRSSAKPLNRKMCVCMKHDKLRVAVVGLGFGAEFAPIYLDHPDVESVAICDANPDRLRAGGREVVTPEFTGRME